MPQAKKSTSRKATEKKSQRSLEDEVQPALAWLKRHGTRKTREAMARYAIPYENAFGVTMANIQVLAKRLGKNHERWQWPSASRNHLRPLRDGLARTRSGSLRVPG